MWGKVPLGMSVRVLVAEGERDDEVVAYGVPWVPFFHGTGSRETVFVDTSVL